MTEGMDIVYLDNEERARFPYGLTPRVVELLENWAARRWKIRVTTVRDGKEIEAACSRNGQLYWNDIG